MPTDFDKYIERRNTDCVKYDFAVENNKPADVLPLWIADMDFKAPETVIEALIKRCEHGIFGYSDTKEDYFQVLQEWFKTKHNWQIKPEWLVKTPGVVFAFSTAIRILTNEGDAVLIQQPVYHPFEVAIKANNRKMVVNQLIFKNARYEIDFDDFEAKIVKEKVKLFIACNPHNPVGRVWSREDLEKLGDICLKHNVFVVVDEIHQEFIYPGHKHFVFADLKPEFAQIAITCTAPSKTFNVAGLQTSNIFIANQDIKRKFCQEMEKIGYGEVNLLGAIACKEAYSTAGPWLEEMLVYLKDNLNFLRSFLKENLPKVKLVEPEGTYVAWLDFSEFGLTPDQLDDTVTNKAKLWLDPGRKFGLGGEQFQRVNMACPRSTLQEALEKLAAAFK